MPVGRASLAEGTLLEGRYRIDRVVAEGGFGVVYAGHHLTLDVPIAIKLLRLEGADDDAEASARFLDEARTVSRLRHDHIVRVLDVGISQDPEGGRHRAWLVMEWCGGSTLRDDLAGRITPRSLAETWALMRPIVEAVGVAHKHGVVHRDIKPSNIMLVDSDDGGVSARLIDFGIAKRVDPKGLATISTGPRAFTPGYAAPEQVAGTRNGPWTDVHALALVLTEMLIGAAPYGATTEPAAIMDPKRPTPKTFGVEVGEWEAILVKAMALRATERYQDANELLVALADAAPASIRAARTPRISVVVTPGNAQAPTELAVASGHSDRTEMETLDAVASEREQSTRVPVRKRSAAPIVVGAAAAAVAVMALFAYKSSPPVGAGASTEVTGEQPPTPSATASDTAAPTAGGPAPSASTPLGAAMESATTSATAPPPASAKPVLVATSLARRSAAVASTTPPPPSPSPAPAPSPQPPAMADRPTLH